MLSAAERQRYRRHIQLSEVGEFGQARLRAARVLVVGAGGLGCPVLQYLAAAGVGTLGIADADRVETSNLQRQILYGPADVGLYKAEAAAREVHRLNPLIVCRVHLLRVTLENVSTVLADYDVIVDGTDNFPTRYLLNDACVSLGLPLVSGAIYRYEGQVSVFNFQAGPTYRCLFPTPPGADEAPDCTTTGVLGVLPGLIGTAQATEVLKVILVAIGQVLTGRLWVLDARTFETRLLRFARHPDRSQINLETANPADYQAHCAPTATITAYELQQQLRGFPSFFLLDVREPWEYESTRLPGALLIRLADIAARSGEIPRDTPVVVYCQSGVRSAAAVALLQQELGFTNLVSLAGGLNAM